MISIIAALGRNGELGKNNDLIWHLPGDLKFFKETTTNHTIIMGYNTYLSIGRALPNRRNVVLVHDKSLLKDEGLVVYDNMEDLIKNEINDSTEAFITGGCSLYKYFYDKADRMYLTMIEAEDNEAEVYFPNINKDEWTQTFIKDNEDNNIKYSHILFERIK